MLGSEYQARAMEYKHGDDDLLNALLGMCGEAGECADMYKKHVFQGHEFKTDEFLLEVGDVLWYVACACEAMGASLDEVMQRNLDKLAKRYPDGYSNEASINRTL